MICGFGGRWIVSQLPWDGSLRLLVFVPCYGLELSLVAQVATLTDTVDLIRTCDMMGTER
jgi:hypothetical protein